MGPLRVALICLASVAVLAVGMASAHTTRYGSKVRITDIEQGCETAAERRADAIARHGCVTAEGRVRSSRGACRRGRTVRVFFKQPGPDDLRAKLKSGSDGEWGAPLTFVTAGGYYAKVNPRRIGPRGHQHRHKCKGARSPVYLFDA